jgi:hypothetical protein
LQEMTASRPATTSDVWEMLRITAIELRGDSTSTYDALVSMKV